MKNCKRKLLATMISSSFLITACGGGSGGNDNPIPGIQDDLQQPGGDKFTPPLESKNLYSGDSNISGVVSLSALVGADADNLNDVSAQEAKIGIRSYHAEQRALNATGDNAIVKLFAVGKNGVLEETGIDCKIDTEDAVDGNPSYACDGIADGQNYVVKYIRILDDNKALEMKVNIKIPEGTVDAPADEISPQSTVVADTIVNAILSATEGKKIDPEIVDDIIKSVKEVVVDLVTSGAIQVPSMVVEAPKNASGEFITDASFLNADNEITFDSNDKLESTAGTLLSNETISRELDAAKVEIEIQDLTAIDIDALEGKRELIKKIFNKLLDDDVPAFIVDFFADRFTKDHEINIGSLFSAVETGLEINERLGFDRDSLNLSAEDATTELQELLREIYALQDKKEAETLSEEDKKYLAEIPAIIPAIFPASEWAGAEITPDTVLDVPQSIVMTIFVADKYVPDTYESNIDGIDEKLRNLVSVDSENEASREMEFENPVDFNPMHFDGSGDNPGLLQMFGFFDEDYINTLSGVEISHLDVMPDKTWIENSQEGTGGKEHDMLRAHVCINDLSLMASQPGEVTQGSDLTVALSYPKRSGGHGSVALINEADLFNHQGDSAGMEGPESDERGEEGFESCFTLDPWAAAHQTQNSGDDIGHVQPSLDDFVSDFKSGEYEIVVKDSAGSILVDRKFQKKVIVGMQHAAPQLKSPLGMPQWPAECQFSVSCPQWDELNSEWTAKGGSTTFPLNANSSQNIEGVKDRAKVTMSWGKPAVELPEGVKMAYSLNVVMNGGCDDNGCRWKNIYSSHEHDKRLFGNSFTLPTLLEKLEVSDNGNYSVNVCAEFIDTDNGEYLGSGGCGFADFHVGEPLNLDAQFSITGKAPADLSNHWKVALISEQYRLPTSTDTPSNSEPERETINVSEIDGDGNYSLSPSIGDFLGTQQQRAHFAIILFKNSEAEESQSTVDSQEQQFWPHWESNLWFDTWGGNLRVVSEFKKETDDEREHQEIMITGGEDVKGPDFSHLSDIEEQYPLETPPTTESAGPLNPPLPAGS